MADRAASGSDLPAAGSLPLDGDLAPECGQERIPSIDHGNDRSADQADDNRWQQADLLALIAPELSHADSLRLKPPRPSAQDREASSRSQASRLEASAVRGVGPVCPQTLLLLDTETTGLSPDAATCIEVGAILFHVPTRAVLSQLSFLLPCASNPAEAINGIPAAVTRLSQPWKACLACFEAMLAAADAVLAHHAAFDRQWFGREPLPPVQLPWICSMEDIRWPPERQLRPTPSVRDLALAYGVPVWAAHRALTDCIYLAQVFERCEELEALLVAALEPRRLYRARLSYDERHRAREAGFRWNNPVPGAWSRRLSEHEAAALDFPVVPVESPPLPRSA